MVAVCGRFFGESSRIGLLHFYLTQNLIRLSIRPAKAIPASARLLRTLFQQFGNLGLAAAAYNAGPKRIQDWLAKKGPLPQETQGYVKTITGRPAETWKVAQAGSPEMRLPRHAPCQEKAGLMAWDGPEHIPMPPARVPAPSCAGSCTIS